MTTKVQWSLAAIAVGLGVGTALWFQHRSVQVLREENRALRAQLAALTQLAEENQRLSNRVAKADRSLSEGELAELNRLRGEVGALRRQSNDLAQLRGQARQAPAAAVRPAAPAEEEAAAQEERAMNLLRLQDAKSLLLAMHMHASDNQGGFLGDFSQLAPYVGSLGKEKTDAFELVYRGRLDELGKRTSLGPDSVIVVREREPRPTRDGRWARAYGFADGHSEVHVQADSNFDPWERPRMVPVAPAGE
jgi:uncharacterized protein YigA (DUF484 family)